MEKNRELSSLALNMAYFFVFFRFFSFFGLLWDCKKI